MNFRLLPSAPSISIFFICIMLILPFLFPHHPQPIPTFYTEWLTALFAFFALLPMLNQKKWSAYQVPVIIMLPVAMIGVLVLQYIVLDIAYWQHYVLVTQYLIVAAFMMMLGSMLKTTLGFDKVLKYIAIALLISGLINVAYVMLDMMGIHLAGWIVTKKGLSAFANIGQPNHLATLLGLALASLGFLYVRQSIKSLYAWPLVIVLLTGLALTASRSTWIYVSLLPLTSLLYRWQVVKQHAELPAGINRRLLALLIVPVLYLFTQMALPHLPTTTPVTTTNQRLLELAGQKDSPRLQIYQASWFVFADNPILGTGFGQMAGHELNHASRVPALAGNTSQAHNIVLQLLAEAGVVGATLFLVCMIAFVVRVKSAPMSQERWLWWLLLLIIGTHAMLEYPLWYLHYLAPVGLLLGLGDWQFVNINKRYTQLGMAMLLVLYAASMVQIMHDYRVIEGWLYQNKKTSLTEDRFDLMFKQLQPVRAFSPLASYADNQMLLTLPLDKNSIKEKLQASARLLKSNYSPAIAYSHATLLTLDGQFKAAKAHLANVHMRYPRHIDAYWKITVDLTLKGELSLFPLVKYIEDLRDGVDPNYVAPQLNHKPLKRQQPVRKSDHSVSRV